MDEQRGTNKVLEMSVKRGVKETVEDWIVGGGAQRSGDWSRVVQKFLISNREPLCYYL